MSLSALKTNSMSALPSTTPPSSSPSPSVHPAPAADLLKEQRQTEKAFGVLGQSLPKFVDDERKWPVTKMTLLGALYHVNGFNVTKFMANTRYKPEFLKSVDGNIFFIQQFFSLFMKISPEAVKAVIVSLPRWSVRQAGVLSDGSAVDGSTPASTLDSYLCDWPHPFTVWEALKVRLEANVAARKVQLLSELADLSFTDKTFQGFVSRLNLLCLSLESCHHPISDESKLIYLYKAMPSTASTMVSTLQRDKNTTFQSAVSDLEMYFTTERYQEAQVPKSSVRSLQQQTQWRSNEAKQPQKKQQSSNGSTCKVHGKGHSDKGCRVQRQWEADHPGVPLPKCYHCSHWGHKKSDCPMLHPNLKSSYQGKNSNGPKPTKPQAKPAEDGDEDENDSHAVKSVSASHELSYSQRCVRAPQATDTSRPPHANGGKSGCVTHPRVVSHACSDTAQQIVQKPRSKHVPPALEAKQGSVVCDENTPCHHVFVGNKAGPETKKSDIQVDSGSEVHVFNDKRFFTNLERLPPRAVRLTDFTETIDSYPTHKGTVLIQGLVDGQLVDFCLELLNGQSHLRDQAGGETLPPVPVLYRPSR